MRKLLSICGVGALLVLPALCSAVQCSLPFDSPAPASDCCPRGSGSASHKNHSHSPKPGVATCPYFFLDKIKKAAVYTGAAPLMQWSPLPPAATLAQTHAWAPRFADRSQTYLFNHVLLL